MEMHSKDMLHPCFCFVLFLNMVLVSRNLILCVFKLRPRCCNIYILFTVYMCGHRCYREAVGVRGNFWELVLSFSCFLWRTELRLSGRGLYQLRSLVSLALFSPCFLCTSRKSKALALQAP